MKKYKMCTLHNLRHRILSNMANLQKGSCQKIGLVLCFIHPIGNVTDNDTGIIAGINTDVVARQTEKEKKRRGK